MYKINAPEFKKVNRSQYGRGRDFKQVFVEYIVDDCYIPTSGNCFNKCNNYLTGEEYTEELLTFIQTEQRRSNIVTSARIQPFYRKYNINIDCFDGTRTNPRNITQKNIAFKVHNNHFFLMWKSDGISFNQATKKYKITLKLLIVLYLINMLKILLNYEYKPKISISIN